MNEGKDSRVDRLLSRLVTPGRLGLSEENKKGEHRIWQQERTSRSIV